MVYVSFTFLNSIVKDAHAPAMNKELLKNAGELSANPLITKKVSNLRLIDEHYADSAGWVLTAQSAPKIEIENSLTFLNCSDI